MVVSPWPSSVTFNVPLPDGADGAVTWQSKELVGGVRSHCPFAIDGQVTTAAGSTSTSTIEETGRVDQSLQALV
jgi:hypothetical protein